ncbi:diguanylate cyclase [Mariniblastus sp.]|nr:diguanylate cyclase [Mariniblastus sp.]
MILLSTLLGIFPDSHAEASKRRELIAESVALSFSTMASSLDDKALEESLIKTAERFPEIQSIGVREADNFLILEIGDHSKNWQSLNGKSTTDQILVPLYGNGESWGQIEFRFTALKTGLAGFLSRPEMRLAGLFGLAGFFTFYIYLRFVLRQMNSSGVVPSRVRDALNTLGEGLIVVNRDKKIVLANQVFQTVAGKTEKDLVGRDADLVAREAMNLTSAGDTTPWRRALEGESIRGRLVTGSRDGKRAAYMVNATPILDGKGVNRGAIASFEDVTLLERKKDALEAMLLELDASSSEIKRQNRELELLATRDPLTNCLNRRAFFELFDQHFENAQQHELPITACMVDIDHFKLINDTHGHATGDEVLVKLAALLQSKVRDKDVVCRYGGEEFSILLPNTSIHQACVVAEQIRAAVQELNPAGMAITTSIGVSALSENPKSPEDMLEQADKCLYVAKRNGRNQVVRWDDVPDDIEVDESKISRGDEGQPESRNRIPFHAITALISALAYRDQETANHSRRVADLCVAVAEGLISAKASYTLEVAGLLHDIGKIGVADSILLKAGKLDEVELATMKKHERIGIELIHTSFNNPELDEIVSNYRVTHSERIENDLQVPIAARILAIADAYDSMITDKPYRKGLNKKAAFAELRRCSGTQFEPELVERFIQVARTLKQGSAQLATKVSKQAALNIGLQIERLAEALDSRDKMGIGTIACRLSETATKHGVPAIAEKANEITREIELNGELYDLLRCTVELMDICRHAQRSLVSTDSEESDNMISRATVPTTPM